MTFDLSNALRSGHVFLRPNLVAIGHWPQLTPSWSLTPASWMLIFELARPITCTCVFARLILRPSWELDLNTSETNVCRSSSDSARIAMSSANLRLLMIVPFMQAPTSRSWSAYSMATSSNILKSCSEIMHPCLTPTLVVNQSVREPFTLTALWD